VQLDNGVKVSPSGWQCSKCDLKENLWLNLTDGTILCGRRNFDGSGGNGHALEVCRASWDPAEQPHWAVPHRSACACVMNFPPALQGHRIPALRQAGHNYGGGRGGRLFLR